MIGNPSVKNSVRCSKARLPLIVAGVLVLIAVFVSLFREMGVVALLKLRNTEEQLHAEVEQLRKENAELKARVEDLRSNPAVIEDEARKMGLVREKEKVIVVSPRRGLERQTQAGKEGQRP